MSTRRLLPASALLIACSAEDPRAVELVSATASGLYEISLALDGPVEVGVQTGTLRITPLVGEEGCILNPEVVIALDMPAHEHGVHWGPELTSTGLGAFDVYWTWPMAGEWVVTTSVDDKPGPDLAVFDVAVE